MNTKLMFLSKVPANVIFAYQGSYWIKGRFDRTTRRYWCTRLSLYGAIISSRDDKLLSSCAYVLPIMVCNYD